VRRYRLAERRVARSHRDAVTTRVLARLPKPAEPGLNRLMPDLPDGDGLVVGAGGEKGTGPGVDFTKLLRTK
jgi:hypothetical protein